MDDVIRGTGPLVLLSNWWAWGRPASFVTPRCPWLSFGAPCSDLWFLFLFLLRLARGLPDLWTFSSPDNRLLARGGFLMIS